MKEGRHSAGCGHHLFPRHAHRPRRASRRLGATALPPDLPAARLGRARPATRSGDAAERAVADAGHCANRALAARTSRPSASRTSARQPSFGIAPRASPSTTPSSGSAAARRPMVRGHLRATQLTAAEHRGTHGTRARRLFLRHQDSRWILGEVPGARAARRGGGACCSAPWTAWLVWKLTYGAVHATDVTNASPHHALQHPRESLGSLPVGTLRHPARPSFPRCAPLRGNFGTTANPRARPGHPHLRRGGRPAGGALRPVLLPRGPGQEHLRHRLLPAHAYRARGLREPSTAS